ncbi:hypothetical protein MMC22_006942 [Lobaria immixta]|nr:hypothetical protein [Lobaria immixta]
MLATQDDGLGEPAKIHLKSEVTGIDPSRGTITFDDASSHTSDLVIGADGIHSLAATFVPGCGKPATATGFSAFRFLVPTDELLADEETSPLVDGKDGNVNIFIGREGRRLDGTYQQNYPIFLTNANSSTPGFWRKAHDLKLWKLLYREPIPKWYRQRLVLIGDAAHPMLPHQGQGGAQSIEDGAALGILFSRLPPLTTADDLDKTIAERLQGFESVRKDRASLMQIYSNAGQDESEKIREEAMKFLKKGATVPANRDEFLQSNFGYDVVKDSERVLGDLLSMRTRTPGSPRA